MSTSNFGVSNDHSLYAYLRGEIDDLEFIRRDIELWRQKEPDITAKRIRKLLDAVPLMPGAKNAISGLRNRGFRTAIVSAELTFSLRELRVSWELTPSLRTASSSTRGEGCLERAAVNRTFIGGGTFGGSRSAEFTARAVRDANAAALGEMIYEGAKEMKNFAMFTLGTGVGSGIVVNGDLVYGHDGFAGECGHTTLVTGGRLCGCNSLGHLEAYCSAPGMKRTAFELMVKYNATDSLLADKSLKNLTPG